MLLLWCIPWLSGCGYINVPVGVENIYYEIKLTINVFLFILLSYYTLMIL